MKNATPKINEVEQILGKVKNLLKIVKITLVQRYK